MGERTWRPTSERVRLSVCDGDEKKHDVLALFEFQHVTKTVAFLLKHKHYLILPSLGLASRCAVRSHLTFLFPYLQACETKYKETE